MAYVYTRNGKRDLMVCKKVAFFTLLFSLHWLLSACGPTTIKDLATQTYIPIQGWALELNQDVVIPAGRTRIFFQEGRLLTGINEYEPHCQLRVRDISDQPRSVQSDRFTIDKVFGTVTAGCNR